MLWRLRVLCFYTAITAVTIFYFLLFLIFVNVLNASYATKYKLAMAFSHSFIFIAKVICGLKYKVFGLEKLPKTPCIAIANHQSFWDNVFLNLIIPKHSWIIKRELFNIPFFGWGLKMMDPIAIDRSDNISVKQILREGKKKLEQGLWLVIFPESTRLRPDQSAKFKPSAAKLALAAEVPLVCIAHNAGVYWPKGFWIRKPGIIKVKIIDVLSFEQIKELDVRGTTEMAEQIINTTKQQLFEKSR